MYQLARRQRVFNLSQNIYINPTPNSCLVAPFLILRSMYYYLLFNILLIISVVDIPTVLWVALNLPNFLGIEYASYIPAVT